MKSKAILGMIVANPDPSLDVINARASRHQHPASQTMKMKPVQSRINPAFNDWYLARKNKQEPLPRGRFFKWKSSAPIGFLRDEFWDMFKGYYKTKNVYHSHNNKLRFVERQNHLCATQSNNPH